MKKLIIINSILCCVSLQLRSAANGEFKIGPSGALLRTSSFVPTGHQVAKKLNEGMNNKYIIGSVASKDPEIARRLRSIEDYNKKSRFEKLFSMMSSIDDIMEDQLNPLFKAIVINDLMTLQTVKDYGADVNLMLHNVMPIHVAVMVGTPDILKQLIEYGANVNAETGEGNYSPLHLAVLNEKERDQIVQILLANKANVRLTDSQGDTPLHFFAVLGDHKAIALLHENGALINAKNNSGKTPLHYFVEYGNIMRPVVEKVDQLIKLGADINAQENDGNTPLHKAVERDAERMVSLLIDKGASLTAKNLAGKTPHDIAREKGYTNLSKILYIASRKHLYP